MKRIYFLFSVAWFSLSGFGQTETPVPEFKNTVIYVDTTAKTSISLEKANGELDYKVKGMGYGGGDMYIKLKGKSSSVQLSSESTIDFVAKLPDPELDPSTTVYLLKFDIQGDRRKVKVSSRKFGGGTRNVDINIVELSFRKISSGVYLVIPGEKLKKGAYGFMLESPASFNTKQTALVHAFDVK